MSELLWKRDRTARLLKIQLLLSQYPHGIEIKEIAVRCSVSKRTVYRDLIALEAELDVPIWEDGSKRGVVEGHFLPPVTFTVQEAVNIFLAIRFMRKFSRIYDPNVASTFIKLNSIVPKPLNKYILTNIEYLQNQSKDETRINNYYKLVQAWLSQHKVKICYQMLSEETPKERIIDPYYIEPSILRRTLYVVGYCHLSKITNAFNIDRIIGDVHIESNSYEIPPEYNDIDFLDSIWDTYVTGKVETVKLHFNKKISDIVITETKLHHSQTIKEQSDGSVIVTLRVRNTIDFCSWILGWGDNVEVLEPEILRNWIIKINKSVRNIYSTRRMPVNSMYIANTPSVPPVELTNEQWKLVSTILPPHAKTGRPRATDRNIINGILWVLKSGARWADVPRKYGSPSTCYYRLQSWQKQGTWNQIRHILMLNLDEERKGGTHLNNDFLAYRKKRKSRKN